MARPSDWSPVDMDSDPTPGDPEEIRTLADSLQDFADDVGEALGKIRAMASDRAMQDWAGLSAEAFRSEFDEVPGNLTKLHTSYQLCAQALSAYAPQLDTAQGMADRALQRALEAQADLTTAQGQLADAQDWVTRAGQESDRLQQEGHGSSAPPPDEAQVRAATRNAQAAHDAATAAQTRVEDAQQRLDAARELARQARDMREDAARTCAQGIDEASDAGIHNRHWWEDAIHWVTENWDTIVAVCKTIVAVLGIVVMIIGGPLAWVVLAAALVVLADTLIKYANGRASLWDVAFAALDCIPGMKGITTLGGLARGLRGGLSAARTGLRGIAQGVKGLAGRGRTMLADGMEAARSRFRNLIRSSGSDPVDMATGLMYLPQTDVLLPGTLPLSFTRRVESGYRTGLWFGPSWSSTCDQRLEIDEKGVVFVAEDGMVLAYPHLPPGTGTAVLPASGPRWPLSRLADGRYAVTEPSTGRARHFALPDAYGLAQLERIQDRNGNTIDFAYTADGVPTAIRHSGGYHLKLTSAEGRITSLSLAGADGEDILIRRYRYDADGNLCSVVNSSGHTLRFTYDDRLRVTSWTDSNDRRYSYTYDEKDRCVAESGEAGHIAVALDYDGALPDWPGMRVTTLTTAAGAVSRFVTDDTCQVVAEIDANGGVTRTSYGDHHRVVATTDATGHTTRIEDSPETRSGAVVRPDGTTMRYVHEEAERRDRVVLPDGNAWEYAFDERGNRTAVTDPSGATTEFDYNDTGGLAAVTDPLGATTRIRCNPAGLPVEVTDPLGNRQLAHRDAFGRLTEITDPLGAVTRLSWTVEGRLAALVGPDGSTETWEYDGEGNCVRHANAAGAVTAFEYTHFDVLAARTDPDGTRYEFEHDASLRLTQVTGPHGLTWRYEYDEAGRLSAETDFDGRRITYRHDAAGRLVARTNPLGQTVTYAYDSMGRLVRKDAGGVVTEYAYDAMGNMVRARGQDCEVRWERDAGGRVLSEEVDGRIMSFSYDAAGRRLSRTTPGGARAEYAYNATGRRVALTSCGQRLDFDYDAAGRETSRRVGGGLHMAQSWDALGRLTEQALTGVDGLPWRRTYAYRTDGNLIRREDSRGGPTEFELDRAGRICAVRAHEWTESYAYDAAGNQTHASWPDDHPHDEARGARSYQGSRIISAGAVRYEYDPAGRVIRRRRTRLSRKPAVWSYEWDAEDRLTAVTTPDGIVWRYRYDPFGRRVSKRRMSADGATVAEEVRFAWDGSVLAEQTTSRPDLPHRITLTWDHDGVRPLCQAERLSDAATQEEIDARFFAIVTDLVGTPTELVDDTGKIAWRPRTTLWGTTAWPSGSNAYTPLRFPGQYHDAETGLHYNHHRYYDPESARYLTSDPLGLAQAPNPVAYIRNPLMWADPLGLGPYREFAHGTSLNFAEDILANGLSADAGRAATNGGAMSRPGSFFTHEVAGGDSPGFQSAYEWGLRVDGESPSTVIVGRLPESTYQRLLDEGLVEVRTVGEGVPDETIFHPDSFETLNREMNWIAKVTP
ncbi:RHS repeat-associated core domain-containing protein [Streptomyces hoynatensis]|uniref:Type IV secretion protein Rhs n=1 Tax=Streptomyces hoynatensis TaxID=1141874 RepID=A0A3A9ZHE3_9ACTN|nr:RHS repeat-associated core domain-containing protein [Streptomyces hoynatensis]RKN46686.1 hypothetical protein D7294_00155 [Streptomyces hoynatensis]